MILQLLGVMKYTNHIVGNECLERMDCDAHTIFRRCENGDRILSSC